MSNITSILNNASALEVAAPSASVKNPIKNLWVTGKRAVNTGLTIANEGIIVVDDIISIVPVAIQGLKESIQITALFARAVSLNSVLTEAQIKVYDSLNSAQRTAFRKGLAEKGGSGFVKALTELFADEA